MPELQYYVTVTDPSDRGSAITGMSHHASDSESSHSGLRGSSSPAGA
jgi:hypothetical protein